MFPCLITTMLIAIAPLAVPPAPGDALVLDEAPTVRGTTGSGGSGWSTPFGRAAGAAAASTTILGSAAAFTVARRRREDEPLFVLVHGHGGSAGDFDELIESMGVPADRVVAFDYRTAGSGRDSTEASRWASTAAAARELEFLIRELSAENSNIYSIHHSKGGAVGVDMIANLDEGRRPPIEGYRGAALLEPAIGRGGLGFLQRFGDWLGPLPDNGGFDPIRCNEDGCRDVREGLGDRSGVEVIAVRNPDALITNFTDQPRDLRTYDLVDDGKPSPWALVTNPIAAISRMFEAHGSVLGHGAVVACIEAEVTKLRSCRWTGSFTPRIGWRGGSGRAPQVR